MWNCWYLNSTIISLPSRFSLRIWFGFVPSSHRSLGRVFLGVSSHPRLATSRPNPAPLPVFVLPVSKDGFHTFQRLGLRGGSKERRFCDKRKSGSNFRVLK